MASPIPVHVAASTSTILPSALCAVSTSISQWGGGSGGHAGVNVVQRKETRRSSSSTTTTLLNLEVAAQVRVSESTHFLKDEGTVRVGASEKGLGFRIIRVSTPT
jgi:hypothetical protein